MMFGPRGTLETGDISKGKLQRARRYTGKSVQAQRCDAKLGGQQTRIYIGDGLQGVNYV